MNGMIAIMFSKSLFWFLCAFYSFNIHSSHIQINRHILIYNSSLKYLSGIFPKVKELVVNLPYFLQVWVNSIV